MNERYVFIQHQKGVCQEVSFDLELANYTLEKKVEKLLNSGDSAHTFYSKRNANWFRNLHQTDKNEKIYL